MNFQRGSQRDEPEMNLIPLIDVLLVILIFLMITTTYSKYSELQINLPTADAPQAAERPLQINVAVTAAGQYVINKTPIMFTTAEAFSNELKRAASANEDPMIVINADAKASHQAVIRVMEAARLANFSRITFSTQTPGK